MAIKIPIVNYSGNLSEISSTDTFPVANLGSGTADATTYLRGDGTWATVAGGSSFNPASPGPIGATTASTGSFTDLSVSGNLTVSGTTTTINSTSLSLSDPIIYFGTGNAANINDLGFVAHFNNGTYQHSGLVRNSLNGKWYLFSGVTTEPTNVISWGDVGFTKDTLVVGSVEADQLTFAAIPQKVLYYRKPATTTLANVNTAQSILGLTSGVTLDNYVYEIEMEFVLVTTGTTGHTEGISFALTGATIGSIGISVNRASLSTTAATSINNHITAATVTLITGSLGSAQTVLYRLKGTFNSTTAGGKLNPMIQFSAAPGGTSTISNAWCKLKPIGSTSSTIVAEGTWA